MVEMANFRRFQVSAFLSGKVVSRVCCRWEIFMQRNKQLSLAFQPRFLEDAYIPSQDSSQDSKRAGLDNFSLSRHFLLLQVT